MTAQKYLENDYSNVSDKTVVKHKTSESKNCEI